MRLVAVDFALDVKRGYNLRSHALDALQLVFQRAEMLLGKAAQAGEVDVAGRKQRHVCRHIMPVDESAAHFGCESAQSCLAAQDVVPETGAGKEQVFKIVIYRFRGGVEIGIYLVEHHFALFVEFACRELRVLHQVGDKFHSAVVVLRRKHRIDHSFLLGSVGIDFAAHALHAVYDMI